MDTITLQCFLALAETGSFTKAADRVARTQSAVSQQIRKLETTLEKKLYERGKHFALTHDGEIFLVYAKQIQGLYQEAIDRFKQPELEGDVKFGMPEDFASVYLSDILVNFSNIHPRVFLSVECDLTLNLLERFKKREFDLVLLKMSRPAEFQHGLSVFKEKLEWVGDPSVIKKMSDKKKSIPLVLSPQPCVYRSRAIGALDKAKIKWRVVFSSPSYAGTIAAVKAGLGITVLPKNIIPDQLHIIRASHLPKLSDTHITLLKHSTKNKSVLSFERFVFEKLNH